MNKFYLAIALTALVTIPAQAKEKSSQEDKSAKGMFAKAAEKYNREYKAKLVDIVKKSESVKEYLKAQNLTLGKLTDVHTLSSFGEGTTRWSTEIVFFNASSEENYRFRELAVMIHSELEGEQDAGLVKADVAVINAQPPQKFETVISPKE
ncbi:MAG: hypothetical protein JWP85_2762 [Rhodoglobus sp.]|nr:hypothetical protein [Rhodoglobus sp.]